MKKANILSCVAISAIVLSGMGITNVQASDNTNVSIQEVAERSVNPEVQNGGKVSDDFQDVSKNNLGYASKFHIFAKEATLNAHTNETLRLDLCSEMLTLGQTLRMKSYWIKIFLMFKK